MDSERRPSELRILMLASLRKLCGNYSTAERIRSHFKESGINCQLKDTEFFDNNNDFERFVLENEVNAILVLHAYRAGKWLYNADNETLRSIPYGVIYGGTDLSEYNKDLEKLKVMVKVVSGASVLVVFSQEMKKKAISVWNECMEANNTVTELRDDLFRSIPQAPVTCAVDRNVCKQVKEQHGLAEESKFFTLVTGIRPIKDPLYLVKQFSEWHKSRRKEAYLIIVGPVLDQSYAETFNAEVENSPGVLYIGARSQPETHAIVRDSTALVNSSVSEGMSVALLEAMELGVPVLARNIAGNTAVIADGHNGLLFSTPQEFIEKAENLLGTPKLHERISQNGIEHIKNNHNIDKERQAYVSLAQELNMLRPFSKCTNRNAVGNGSEDNL